MCTIRHRKCLAAVILAMTVTPLLAQQTEETSEETTKESKKEEAVERANPAVQSTRVDRAFNQNVQRPANQPGYNHGVQRPGHRTNLVREPRNTQTANTQPAQQPTEPPGERARMSERQRTVSSTLSFQLNRSTLYSGGDQPSYSFTLKKADDATPTPLPGWNLQPTRANAGQVVSRVNRDQSIDYLNPTSGRWFFGLKGKGGQQDVLEARTGQWNMGFQNPDGTIDYMDPRTGLWNLAIPAEGK